MDEKKFIIRKTDQEWKSILTNEEFKILRKLLLVHGNENYVRNCTLVLYNFYKNLILLVP